LTPPPQRGPLQFLEILIPSLIAVACLGWLLIRSLQNEDTGHSWVGPFRAAIYLLIYAGIVFPITLRGVNVISRKLYVLLPSSPKWKAFGLFCAPMALGSVLAIISPSATMPIVGTIFGLIISLGSYIFVFNLQPSKLGRGMGIAGGHLAIGTGIGYGVLVGINVLLMAILSVSHSAGEYKESPLGSAFAWNPPQEQTPQHKTKPAPQAPGELVESTQPATAPAPASQPESTTQAATTEAVAIHEQTTTAPSTQHVASTQPGPENSGSHPAVAMSPLLESPPTTVIDDQAMDVYFASVPGVKSCLVLRNRTEFGDELELWTAGASWSKTQSITAQPKTVVDRGPILLSPKSNLMVRMVSLPKMNAQVRPLVGDASVQEKQQRNLDVESLWANGTPSLFGFVSPTAIAVEWHGGSDMVALLDPLAAGPESLRGHTVTLTGLQGRLSNMAITPDARYVVSVQQNPTIGNVQSPGNYFMVDGLLGSDSFHRNTMTNLPADRNIALSGLSVSSDSRRAAVLYMENGNGLLELYHLPDGARTASHIFSGASAQVVTGFRGSAITWIANDSALLINGRYVLDSQNFDQLGDLGIDDVKGVYVIDRTTLALVIGSEKDSNHCSVMVANLNAQKLPAMQPSKPVTRSAYVH
jgi:hypothetical protein